MYLVIPPMSFLGGFSNLAVGRFKKFPLWSFNMIKLLISILWKAFVSLAYLIPSLFIFVAVRLSDFLYFDVLTFCKRFEYSSLLR